MAGDWIILAAKDFCASVRDGTHDSPKSVQAGKRLVTSRHITSRRLDLASAYLIAQEDFDEINRRSKVDKWDVLVSMIGTVGEPCLISEEPDFAIKNIGLFKSYGETEGKYLYYYLQSPEAQQHIREQSRGTTQLYIPLEALRDFPIRVPEQRAEMQAIALILGTLDDKIELNRRMNETLEAMVRALFKSWFVDFDPVRAKAEGRWKRGQSLPGLPAHLFDLFPKSFEDSELGGIPKGWKVSSIGLIADVIDCLHSKKPERRIIGMPLLQLTNIRNDGLIDMQETYFINAADYKKWISRMEAKEGACVITNVGRVGAVAQMPVGQKAALGRNMTGVRCKPSFQFPTLLIECLLSQAMKDEIVLKMDSGTILDALNVRNIPRLRFVCATLEALRVFESLARPLRARMETSLGETRYIAALRDSLLPKLISGELRVNNVEKLLKETVS